MIDIVIGDIHARTDALRTLLHKIGVIECGPTLNSDRRLPGFRLHQLGDAVSLGYGEQEAEFLRYFYSLLADHDQILIGNHELPVMWGNGSMDFHGWDDRDLEAEAMVREAFEGGRYQAASSVGDWLLTHAGLIPVYQKDLRKRFGITHVSEAADWLNDRFLDLINNKREDALWNGRTIHGTMARGSGAIEGMDEGYGGIFWVRTQAHVAGYLPSHHYKQMFGHTPYGPKQLGEYLWLLDTAPRDPDYFRATLASGERPMRSDFGDVAAMVFETPDANPVLVRPYE